MIAFIPSSFTSRPIFSTTRSSFLCSAPFPTSTTPVPPRPRVRKVHQIRLSSVPSAQDKPFSLSSDSSTSLPSKFFIIRFATFVAISLTYAAYVLLRSTFTYVAPVMATTLSLSLTSIGKISSAFPLAYGMSRLLTGLLVDRTAPHKALCLGLFLAGLLNASMSVTTVVPLLALLWALNGLVQGVGAGATAKIITAWFPAHRRGFYWGLWSTSANIGAFLAPMVSAGLAQSAGFRAGLIVPGLATAAWAAALVPFLRSAPSDAGFVAPWEESSNKPSESSSSDSSSQQDSWRTVFVRGVLRNHRIWLLALSYFFVYFVRSGSKSWLHFWLVEARGINAAEAAYRVSGMEVGGILGTFSAGVVSDSAGGRRVLVTMTYMVGVVLSLIVAWLVPGGSVWASFAAFSVFGFMINGPQMMIGLIGAELCDKRVMATASGMLGWISYLGAAASGFPLSVLVRQMGWPAFFASLIVGSLGAILSLSPMWRLRATSARS